MTIEQFYRAKAIVDGMERVTKKIKDLKEELGTVGDAKTNKVLIVNYVGTFEFYPDKGRLARFLQEEISALESEKVRLAKDLEEIR